MTDEQIAEWTTRNDIMLGPDGIDSRRMYPESVIPTAEVTAKLREMRDAYSELLAAYADVLRWAKLLLEEEELSVRVELRAVLERAGDGQPAPEPITQAENPGLYNKYIVTKRNGNPVDPKAEYLVLRLDNDETCRVAALAWADAIQTERPELADGIRAWVELLTGKERAYALS